MCIRDSFHVGAGLVKCRRSADNAGNVFGSGPLATLLCAAADHVYQRDAAFADIQNAHALRPMELVGGKTCLLYTSRGRKKFERPCANCTTGIESF